MSFLKSLSYGQQVVAETTEAIFPPYYACGPGGETFYVWSTFASSPDNSDTQLSGPPRTDLTETPGPVHCLKRRVTNNRKERRRTLSINNAFADLRACIPNIPADSKLSKIKTLRLATSYIAYLRDVLAGDESGESPGSFKAEITKPADSGKRRDFGLATHLVQTSKGRRSSGRTGWPQHVWALELKHENPS